MDCIFWFWFYKYTAKQCLPPHNPCWKMLTLCSVSAFSPFSPPSPIQLIHLCKTVSNLKPFCHICWRDNRSFSLTFCQLSVVIVFQLITWCKSYKINTQWEGEKCLVSCFNIFLCSPNADGHFPNGLSVQCHQLNSQISLPPERYELSLVSNDFLAYLWQYFIQTDMPGPLFPLYFIIGIEISDRKFTR